MSDINQNKNSEDGAVTIQDLNKVNRIKAQEVLDNFFKPMEAKSDMVGILISNNPRTIKFVRRNTEEMKGNEVDVHGNLLTDKKIIKAIKENKERKALEEEQDEEDIYRQIIETSEEIEPSVLDLD